MLGRASTLHSLLSFQKVVYTPACSLEPGLQMESPLSKEQTGYDKDETCQSAFQL